MNHRTVEIVKYVGDYVVMGHFPASVLRPVAEAIMTF